MQNSRRIVLAYSGGLDTSIILKWLKENYNAEVIVYTADIGQKINKKAITKNAKSLGAKKIIIENLKDIFVKHGYEKWLDKLEIRIPETEVVSKTIVENA